jgi:thermostable 8-oxoguanine DNA glycosylase
VFSPATDHLNYEFSYNPDETDFLKSSMKRRAKISIDDLRRIALWKLDRVLNVPAETLQLLASIAATKGSKEGAVVSKKAIMSLVACEGVGYPMASAFLKFLRPDLFPIIDVRAYRALTGTKLRYDQYNLDLYLAYIQKIREIASATGRPFSEVDEQLYCFDKEHNGEI